MVLRVGTPALVHVNSHWPNPQTASSDVFKKTTNVSVVSAGLALS